MKKFLFLVLVTITWAAVASGETVRYTDNCYKCVHRYNLTIINDYCRVVGDGEYGKTECFEEEGFTGSLCYPGYYDCYNTVVDSGGGGTGGSPWDKDNGCTYPCPSWCDVCHF